MVLYYVTKGWILSVRAISVQKIIFYVLFVKIIITFALYLSYLALTNAWDKIRKLFLAQPNEQQYAFWSFCGNIYFCNSVAFSPYNVKPSSAESKMKKPLSNYHIYFPHALKTMQIPKFPECVSNVLYDSCFLVSFVKYENTCAIWRNVLPLTFKMLYDIVVNVQQYSNICACYFRTSSTCSKFWNIK